MQINTSSYPCSAVSISQSFLDYFEFHGYQTIPGSSLLDPSVPMSFVMSAGLVQVERSAALQGGRKHDRYVLLQNCFRYFDLDTIGDSPYHLTLFRMAGVFTFGNIDKYSCISNNWDLLVRVFGLSPESLWATYFAGGEVGGYFFEPDTETYQAWQQVGVPSERIIGLGPDDNFWKQGNSVVGEAEAPKCGPNTEVFYDRGSKFQCGSECKPGCRCGRFVEIQNTLLITWYLDEEKGVLEPLEESFVESVIGVERLEMVLQGKTSIFEINKINQIVEYVRQFELNYVAVSGNRKKQERILVDHILASLFLVADGVEVNEPLKPGRGGRARLMRKLVRGALMAIKLLGISDEQFLPALIDYAENIYTDQHKNLKHVRDLVLLHFLVEEELFEETLAKGKHKFIQLLQAKDGKLTPGDIVNLEKSKGIPKPLLVSMLQQSQVPFDRKAYEIAYAAWYKSITH